MTTINPNDTASDATREYYALPDDVRATAESLAGKLPRPMSHIEVLLAIGKAMMMEREAATRGEG